MTDDIEFCDHSWLNFLRPVFPSPRLYRGKCSKCGSTEWIITSKENEAKIRAKAASFNGRFRRNDGR